MQNVSMLKAAIFSIFASHYQEYKVVSWSILIVLLVLAGLIIFLLGTTKHHHHRNFFKP